MRSVLADLTRGRLTGARRRLAVTGLVVGVLLAAGTSACSRDTSIAPPTATAGTAVARAADARETVAALDEALRRRDQVAAAALGVAGTADLLSQAVENVSALDLVDLSLRFVEDRSSVSPQDDQSFGPHAWIGTVEITYRLRGWDDRITEVETPMTFVPGEGGQLIADIGGADGRTPLWIAGRVTTLAEGRALVISRGVTAQRYVRLATRALADVAEVLPEWAGRLVIEVPATQQELDEALDAPQERYANIAAVTAAVDGSLERTAPVHVFVNPAVFDPLGPRAAQVVISHESTHVATAGTSAVVPGWLLEGFADYVALASSEIPVSTAAAQILAEVRRDGPPKRLPTADDLAPTAPGLGATYEEAWLANRFIALRYGEEKLVAFYRSVAGGTAAAEAFRQVLGTTEPAFVSSWRADLQELADDLAG